MKIFKKNQIIIYVIALMLVAAGYLNFTANNASNNSIQASSEEEMLATTDSNIGDAQLVNSNDISKENKTNDDSLKENIFVNGNNTTVQTSSTEESNNYFKTSKLERDKMYSQMIETYEKILNSNNSTETQKQSATEEIAKINNIKNSIMVSENLIKTKGFENNIIFVNNESISIVIGKEELNKEEVAQIQNIISREMNAKAENIHISNR